MRQLVRGTLVAALVVGAHACNRGPASSVPIVAPQLDAKLATAKDQRLAVLAGGCFWGVQAVFEHVRGVRQVVAGYSGGAASTADYETVSTGQTGHAESVKITYDPSQITYGQLLRVFFSVAHDPTELNRQGPDQGTQYRSIVFYVDAEEQRIAEAYIAQLDQAGVFSAAIVTKVVALDGFYPAEAYHQDYAVHHPYDPYIVINDAPKVANLRSTFPDLYVSVW
jgi:peptide-methionine (S)-S-oxide reductase